MIFLYALTLFISASLLFGVQPMIAKQRLPELGGAPIVWNTCLVFFQTMLLAGYCYAHFVTKRLVLRRQLLLHTILFSLPLFSFIVLGTHSEGPISAPPSLQGWLRDEVHLIVGLAVTLTVSIGVPVLFLSSSAPILQRWYWRANASPTSDPYFLYVASNLGSLAALLGYPLLERFLGLSEQAWLWCLGYGSLFVLISICAMKVWKVAGNEDSTRGLGHGNKVRGLHRVGAVTIPLSNRLRWLVRAAGPSGLLVSVTQLIATDVASVPFVWVIPLAVYLFSFALTFTDRPLIPHLLVLRYFPLLLILWGVTILIGATEPASVLFTIHLATFFVASLACHGELYQDRPPPEHLTSFYLWLALGGVVGSLLSALVAPLIFDSFVEYPILLIGCFVIATLPWRSGQMRQTTLEQSRSILSTLRGDVAIAGVVGVFVVGAAYVLDLAGYSAARTLEDSQARYLRGSVFAIPLVFLGIWSSRTLRFSLGLAAILLGAHLSSVTGKLIHADRTWFGMHRVSWDTDHRFHQLVHGTTVHGRQAWPPTPGTPPGAYYHSTGPLGDVFEIQGDRGEFHRVAVAGLGAGCIAYYGSGVPDQHWTFFEIDPGVVEIATDSRLFTFLSDAFPDPSRMQMVIGDARFNLAKRPDSSFDLIILDAFSSDSIPVHLLTQEALDVYMSKLADGGLVAFHISNRHLEFRGLLANLASTRDQPLVCYACDDLVGAQTAQEVRDGKMASQWVVIARDVSDLGSLRRKGERWHKLAPDPNSAVWTDNYADILGLWKND